MALTADRRTKSREGVINTRGIKANTKIYGGSIVCKDAAGYAVPAADTASFIVLGIAQEQMDNLTGSDLGGANNAGYPKCERGKAYLLAAVGADHTWIGCPCYVVDDQTVCIAGSANAVLVGFIMAVDSATAVWVYVPALSTPEQNTAANVTVADALGLITDSTSAETSFAEAFGNLGGGTSRQFKVYQFWYDFATHGGAQGAITLTKRGGAVAQALPDNFVPIHVAMEQELAFTSGGAATVKLGIAAVTDAIITSQAFDHAQYAINKVNVGVVATSLLKTTAATDLTLTIATADLTAGRVNIYVLGFVGA